VVALSTAWHPRRATRLSAVFARARKAGFTAFELGVSAVPFDLKTAVDEVESGRATVTSVHAVCTESPVPPGTKRGDWLGEPDEDLRRQGVTLVKETLDVARRVGAGAVIVHAGVLPMDDGRAAQSASLLLVSEGADPEGLQPRLDELRLERERLLPPRLRALEASLAELCEYAPDVLVALENRYFMHAFPHGDEFRLLFERVAAPNLRYWHDVGHAHLLDRIGFINHAQLLRQNTDRLAGVHLHDVRDFRDHRPPGEGEFDFGMLGEHLRPEVLRVMEIEPATPARALARGRRHLAATYGID